MLCDRFGSARFRLCHTAQDGITIARIALPLAAAAQAIRDGGASPDYYLFKGAVSTRDGDARQLSNLMLTD